MTHDDESYPLSNDDTDFVEELAAVEQALADLKYRYRDLQNVLRQRGKLEEKREEVQANQPTVALTQELAEINQKIQELSIDLESKLLTDADLQRISRQLYWEALKEGVLREWFWQIVRFGGLGVILGWILKSWAG